MTIHRSPAPVDTPGAPGLAPGVEVHEPMADGAPWIVRRVDGQYVRIGADIAKLLKALDGERDAGQLTAALGPPWTERDVDGVLTRLRPMAVLAEPETPGKDGRARKQRSLRRWIRFVPPLTVQLTLLRPDRLMRWLRPLITMLAHRASLILATAAVIGGMIALALQAPALGDAIGRPQSMLVLVAVVLGSLLTTGLHEFGHGMALSHYGCTPTRMGMMLFYLTPAFFCDVSDGWRLPRNEQRTRVALAGIATQLIVAGVAGLGSGVAALVGAPTWQTGLQLFSVATFVAAIVNVVPFVKFDGYIALMCHLDVPHLRDRSMQDARAVVARVLFGGRYQRSLPDLAWAVPFGLVSIVFPVYLVSVALVLWLDFLQLAGWVGIAAVAGILGYLAYRAGAGFVSLLRQAKAAGARPWRMTLVVTALTGAVIGALALVQVPGSVTGGYVQDGAALRLVLPDTADQDEIAPGDEVTLIERGVLTRRTVGTAVVAPGEYESMDVPLLAFFPISDMADLMVDATGRDLQVTDPPTTPIGMAVVATGDQPLGRWLWNEYLAPVLR